MKSLSLVTSEPHYLAHMQPIWDLIPESHRHSRGLPGYMLVGGYADVKSYPTRDYIYVEHGAGQSYTEPLDEHLFRQTRAFYSGGNGHQRCGLFICPNQEVADRWTAKYPDKPTAVVGCPKLDPWHAGLRGAPEPQTVAITFHWDALFTGIPETASAFSYYLPSLIETIRQFRSQGWQVLGHSHPRYPAVRKFWESPEISELGVEYASAEDVLDRASILIADNTSMQAEFLSLGRPVVWLNAPFYRHDVHHGGRFWDWPSNYGGTVVETGAELSSLDLSQVTATPPTGHPYAFADGQASVRASDAIVSLIS